LNTTEISELDPTAQDAVQEEEDIVPEDDLNEDVENEEATPNNYFCFTNNDFVEYLTQVNDATRHQGKYREVWNIIKVLEEHEEVSRSTADGKVMWKVVNKVTYDDFKDI